MIASGRRAARSFEEQREGIGAFECRNALLVVDALAPLHPMVRRWTENALQYHGARAPDNQQAIHGRREVVIKAGNTGALDFVFNGKKLPSQGEYGEVKRVAFGPDGLQKEASARLPVN